MPAPRIPGGNLTATALALLAALAAPVAARAALAPGAKAPDFDARATLGGREFDASLRQMLRTGPVVVYFYPAAFTKGCTIEAHDFADALPDFQHLHTQVIGVSEDPIGTLDKFSVSACQSRFPVAADPTGAITQRYDAALPILAHHANRTSYAIAPDGTILASYTALDPDGHVSRMLEAVRTWTQAHPGSG